MIEAALVKWLLTLVIGSGFELTAFDGWLGALGFSFVPSLYICHSAACSPFGYRIAVTAAE